MTTNSITAHQKLKGKIEICPKASLANAEALATFYTPGVAEVCMEIHKDTKKSFDLCWRSNTIAIVSDGTAVLGLGDIGAESALPVMEGKSAIFKEFAGINAIPLCINTKDTEEIIAFCKQIAPTFGGINLEDISAPRCFEIEKRLVSELDIPVFHDDQHGTAIATLAGVFNALKVVNKKITDCKIVFSGAGAAGIASARLFEKAGANHIILLDSKGAICSSRTDLNEDKKSMIPLNKEDFSGDLKGAIVNADIFIGLSAPNLLSASDIEKMNSDSIVFAMANPTPEIMPSEAKKGGARVVATGRSDFPNQVNNALIFPGLFRAALKMRISHFTEEMFLTVAQALADMVKNPSEEKILPNVFDKGLAENIVAKLEKI